ncbi:MAG: hypothetical protein JNN25_07040 [Candidatus Kapabacteria bacterium]|nr:hypothetical protein [Candidatus Kapabacteria bacterium]
MRTIYRLLVLCVLAAYPMKQSLAQQTTLPVQESKEPPSGQWSIVFGLTQPLLLGGFNAEVVYWTEHFVFDYSHGFDLKFPGMGETKEQRLSFRMPHTLGLGIGYRFTEALNLRVEPKLHIWDVYYDNVTMDTPNRLASYTTFTLGLGAYYNWLPFKNEQNFLRGITVAPSVRWWPNVATTLQDNRLLYNNTLTKRDEIHSANNIGIANTPFLINISLGYTF